MLLPSPSSPEHFCLPSGHIFAEESEGNTWKHFTHDTVPLGCHWRLVCPPGCFIILVLVLQHVR